MAGMDTRPPLEFLLNRRSVPVRMLSDPTPDDATLRQLLTAASRVPDHGKLVPYRFEVLRKPAIARMARLTREIGTAQGRDPDKLQKQAGAFDDAPLTVAVIVSPRTDSTIPLIEQEQTSALTCLSLVNAAEAAGFAGHWLTAWMARDPEFLRAAFGIEAPEAVTGFVHIGTPKGEPAARPRPDVDAITRWVET
jgi:nitroreductase